MRIRDVMLAGVRGYPELRRVSFVDPLTDGVRQLTVIAGSNGTGKTTFLEAIYEINHLEAYRAFPIGQGVLHEVLNTSSDSSAILVFDELELPGLSGRRAATEVGFGRTKLARHDIDSLVGELPRVGDALDGHKAAFEDHVGLLYFTHNRWVNHTGPVSILEPSDALQPLWRFGPQDQWRGSLSQLWVWQNYLDLEEGREGRPNLTPFVELVETVLGRGRTVRIHKGRVTIEGGGRPAVEPHQLPSGEQQILTLFGELGRRLRPGAVVMIDEVEISLHPALQRKVIAILRDLAAKYDLQIIVTTHSTEILRAVDPSEVVSLDDLES